MYSALLAKLPGWFVKKKPGTASWVWDWGSVTSWYPDPPKNAVRIIANNFCEGLCLADKLGRKPGRHSPQVAKLRAT